MAAERNLLFGLLALQNGIINQVQLVAAFQAWSLDRSRSLADHLFELAHALNLPAIEGQQFWITDGKKKGGGTAALGDIVAGGGAQKIGVRYDGTNWIRCA